MQIKQLSLFVENKPGSLSEVCRVLKEHNISIRTLSLADTQQYGILRLLVKEHEAAKKALEAAGFVVKTTDVLALTIPDRAGGLADVLGIIDRHNLSIEYMYAFTFGYNNQAALVFRFPDPQQVVEELKNEDIKILKNDELFA
jgi:hypothetical protein